MFGRIPRLPIDLALSTVLDVPEVVNYDEYVQLLRRSLKEAMGIAQATASKQLKRHARDHVLLANKGEHGKCKLADRWEDATYLVMGVNADSHTFKIQHSTTGVVKTVHCNLITPVNFLPLPGNASNDGWDLSASSASADPRTEQDVAVQHDDVTSTDATEYRTRVWVSQLTSDGSTDSSMEVDSQYEDAKDAPHTEPSLDQPQACGSDLPGSEGGPIPSPASGHLQSQDPLPLASELGSVAAAAGSNEHSPTLYNAAAPVPPVGPSNSVRSRVGRLLRPVDDIFSTWLSCTSL